MVWGSPFLTKCSCEGNTGLRSFCARAVHPPDHSLHSPPSKGPMPAWSPQSAALIQHLVQVSAQGAGSSSRAGVSTGIPPRETDGKSPVGTRVARGCPGLSDPCGMAQCACRACLRDPRQAGQEAGHAHTDTRPGPWQEQA